MADLKILGIPGSLRKASFNRSALVAAQSLLPAGASLDVFELEGIPVYNQDLDKQPPARVVELKARVRAADAILFATPEYNYSIPGVLKNAIDWASRPYGDSAWQGKPVAVMGASVGILGSARAQYHLHGLFRIQQLTGLPCSGTFHPLRSVASRHSGRRGSGDGRGSGEASARRPQSGGDPNV